MANRLFKRRLRGVLLALAGVPLLCEGLSGAPAPLFVTWIGYVIGEVWSRFPFKELDLGALATGYCLLRLPRIKEILGKQVKGFRQSQVEPSSVPFRNKKQEKLRKAGW